MKKILPAILCCAFILAMVNCGGGASSKYVKTAELMNKSLPVKISNELQLDKAEAASKNEFKYYYTLLIEPTVSADEFVKNCKETLLPTFKGNSQMKDFVDDNMTLIYIYNKADGSKFAEMKITPEEYK